MLTLDNSIVIGSRFKITEESIVRYMKFTIERNGKMSIEFQIFFGIGTPCKTYEEAMKEVDRLRNLISKHSAGKMKPMWVREIGLLRAYMDKNDNSWDQFLMALQDWGGLEQDTCDEIRQLIVRNR